MDPLNAVTLRVNGLDYRGWKKASISAGIERQTRDFSLDVTWRWPDQAEEIPVRQGDFCEVLIGDDLVLTGWVFATPVNYDSKTVNRAISGRSLTADLVDCSAINQPGQWRGQSVQQIVQSLAEPYGVKVLSQVAETTKLAEHSIEPGETVFESIDRLLTLSRLLSSDDSRGRLVIINPGSAGRAVDRLELGQNILTGSASLDFSGVFSDYRVVGQRSGTDDEHGAKASEVQAEVTDPRAARKRVVQNHLEEFVRQFKWALSSRQIFEWQKMTRPETLTDIQRAARFFYLQQHAFGGKVTGQTFGTATTGPAINLLRIEENLSAAWQRLAGTYVENLPWLECAERYDRAHTFHYMDPPYWQTAGYGLDFPFENYERMAAFMRSCKGKVMVSINDHRDIRRVFDGFHFETLDIRYSNTNQRQGKAEVTGELVIMNWVPAALGGLF